MIVSRPTATARRRTGLGTALVFALGLLVLQSAAPARAYSPTQIHIMVMEQVQQMYDAAVTALDQQIATDTASAPGQFGDPNVGGKFGRAMGRAQTPQDKLDVVEKRLRREIGVPPGGDIPDDPFVTNPAIDRLYWLRQMLTARIAMQKASDGMKAHLKALGVDTDSTRQSSAATDQSSAPAQHASLGAQDKVTPFGMRVGASYAQYDELSYSLATTRIGLVSGYVDKEIWDSVYSRFTIKADYDRTEPATGVLNIKYANLAAFRPGWVVGPWGTPEYIQCPDCWEDFLDEVEYFYGPAAADYYDSMEFFDGLPSSRAEAGRDFAVARRDLGLGRLWINTKFPVKVDQYRRLNGRTTFGLGGSGGIFGGAPPFEGALYGAAPLFVGAKAEFVAYYLRLLGFDVRPWNIRFGPFGGVYFDFPTIYVRVVASIGWEADPDDDGRDFWTRGGIIGDYKLGHSLGGLGWLRGGSYDDEAENSLDGYWMDDWDKLLGSPRDSDFNIWSGYELPRVTRTAPIAADDPLYKSRGSWGQDYDDQWAMRYIGLDDRALLTLLPDRAVPVTVAVIDTGVDRTHPELIGAMWTNPNEIPNNGRDDDNNGYIDDVFGWNFVEENNRTMDANGHGTVAAGIIAAAPGNGIGIAGVNPWARIMALKVADGTGAGSTFRIARAIHYAADNGARVINISSTVRFVSRAMYQAVLYARRRGVIVVAAAGNEGADIAGISPGGLPGVLTVAATGPNDRRVGFSNYGPAVEIAAPGVDIVSLRARNTDLLKLVGSDYEPGSAFVGRDKRYYRVNGTSFSAPFVSGVASLLLSLDSKRTPGQVKRMIVHSARDIEAPGWDHLTGYGLLDARAAIKADPDFYAISRIGSVELVKKDTAAFFAPTGTASADKFKRAWFEVGKGKAPTQWTRASDDIAKPVDNAELGLVPVKHFAGRDDWTLRLIVEHQNGFRREARYILSVQ